jgi:PRTRC genetic system protein E
MKVLVMPDLAKGGNPVLAQPLSLAATPEDLDSGFIGALQEFGASRAGLAEQVATTATIIEAHKKTEAGKATKALQSKGTAAANKPAPTDDNAPDVDDDDDAPDQGGGDKAVAPAAATAAAGNDDLLALF